MFDSIEKDKRFQCSSEFGLYRYDSENDCYSMTKKSTGYGFHYLVVLVTSVIVLSAICLVTYSYISDTKKAPRLKFNDTNIAEQNITFSKENLTEATSSGPLDYPEPLAMELRNSGRKSDAPRPFIYEIRDPKPIGFQYPPDTDQSFEAVNVNPHRYRAKNIQEIIKLLEQSQDENKVETPSKKKKKHSRRRGNNMSYLQDPFFPYKPQNPSDVNLLATNGFRFAPTVQLETKKTPVVNEHYPKYEIPPQELPLYLDVQNNQQYTNKRNKKQKNFNNLYNQNSYFNNQRFQQNRVQPYWNRPYWNAANLNHRKENHFIPPHPMIVHLNLYPKKKKKLVQRDQRISESNILQNCTDDWEDEKYSQIKNASEFNQLLEKVRHDYSNDKVTINDKDEHLFRIKNTFFQLDQPELDKMNDNLSNDNIEVQKSIGFTVINPNFSTTNSQLETQWHPIVVDNNNDGRHDNQQNDNYDLEVGEANDNMSEDRHESVTLPLPNDIFQKYFNTKPTPKYRIDWDYDTVQKNPNLVNHRPRFEDGRDE